MLQSSVFCIVFNFEKLRPFTENLLINKPNFPERILVQTAKKLITIAVKDILRIEAFGDYSKLFTKENAFLSNFGISILETKFDPENFIRVHRSSIINIHFVKEVTKNLTGFDVLMINNDAVRVSRSYIDVLKRLK